MWLRELLEYDYHTSYRPRVLVGRNTYSKLRFDVKKRKIIFTLKVLNANATSALVVVRSSVFNLLCAATL